MNRLLTAGLLLVALAAAASAEVVLRAEHHPQSQWKWQHRCAPTDIVNLVVAVRTRNSEAVTARLEQVSNPQHPEYTEYMTLEELGELTRDEQATAAVEEWLAPFASVVDRTVNGDFVTAKLVAQEAERMLQTEFHAYKHLETGKVVFRASSARLPSHVAAAVDYVARVVDFPRARPPTVSFVPNSVQAANKAGDATPPVIMKYYDIPTSKQTPASKDIAVSVFEALGQNYEPADVKKFQQKWGLAVNPATSPVGPNSALTCVLQPNACSEFSLDAQVVAMTNGLPWNYWSIASNDETPFVDWAMAVANSTNPPLVNSISYGGPEAEEPVALQQRFSLEMQKLGLRGVTVLVASGDDGVAGSPARQDPTKCGFNPSFPATIPYIVSVGATMGPEAGKPEVVCASDNGGLITSGGGFSGIFERPQYQEQFVSKFLNATSTPLSMFNSTGRGYPDVALMGHNYEILISGQTGVGSGTSASTPLFAAMVALVNNQRLAAGKKSLGFLNPALYQQAAANSDFLNDITSGDNKCAAGPQGHEDCCPNGFEAVTGWDATSGLGSVNFAKFSSIFASL